ncbi:hypothetical protein WMY93_029701 [Mugilogobius chulae]|uniref:Uncharacterized protein n=1 Tax=Mugilogobius chulae TaxID=88201 RepID=A0AAW0MVR7_9GOBI
MDAGTSTVNQPPFAPSGQSQNQSHGPGAAPAPGVSEDQTHHKPFFYVQPQHPYVPLQSVQWPLPLAMPLNYNPYYGGGYPGFGYGYPLMPHFHPSPYLESPGFVMPHTHHHLMDYRRMLNPQYYQSMAYHARRLRYQQNPPTRDVTSSEVQTEPFSLDDHSSTTTSNPSENSNNFSIVSATSSAQKDDRTLALNDLAPASTNATTQKGSFVIEAEEVRIECCASPAGLQVLHETSELSRRFAQDVVHCSSIVQNSLLAADDNSQNAESKKEKSPQPCPDILLVVSPNANEKCVESEKTPTNPPKIKTVADVDAIRNEKNLKVVRLPFNAKYLAELQRIESSVWSADETLVPSPDFIIDSCDDTLPGEVPSTEMLITRAENDQSKIVPIVNLPKTLNHELEDVVPTFINPTVEFQCREIPKQACVYGKIDLKCAQNLLSDDSPPDGILQDHQDTSFESLPAYLPSTSWLADFDNCRKMPLTPQKQNKTMASRSFNVPARRRKLDAEFKEATAVRKPKEKYKQNRKADRRSLSDHECCVSRSYNENAFVSTKGQRLCTRCSNKQRMYKPSPAQPASKRKNTPFQQWNDVILQTCEACKGHANKNSFARKGSSPDVRMEMEELSENGYKWRLMEEMRKEMKRPLALKQQNYADKCSGSYLKMRERSCTCGETLQTPWHRIYHCPHGNAIREMDENCASTNQEQMFLSHRWQTEKPWKSVPGHNMETLKNDLIRAQHLNLHKKSLPLSQESRPFLAPAPREGD